MYFTSLSSFKCPVTKTLPMLAVRVGISLIILADLPPDSTRGPFDFPGQFVPKF